MTDDKAFLAGIGRLLAEMEASACTPTAMGRVKGSDTARLGCEQLIDLVGPAATLPLRRGRRHRRRRHRVSPTGRRRYTATPGGTVEVFRTIIAQHDLGLPRPEYPGRRVFLTGRPPRHGSGMT